MQTPKPNPRQTPRNSFASWVKKVSRNRKKAFNTLSAASDQTADVIKKCYSNAVQGAQDYSNKVVEFAQTNTNATFDFAQRISGVKSPSEFFELSTVHARQQLETLTNQTTQLVALAQRVSLATAEPLKTGFTQSTD